MSRSSVVFRYSPWVIFGASGGTKTVKVANVERMPGEEGFFIIIIKEIRKSIDLFLVIVNYSKFGIVGNCELFYYFQ